MKKLENQVHELKAKLNDNNKEMLNLKTENIKLNQTLSQISSSSSFEGYPL